jgi:hypothetical protein
MLDRDTLGESRLGRKGGEFVSSRAIVLNSSRHSRCNVSMILTTTALIWTHCHSPGGAVQRGLFVKLHFKSEAQLGSFLLELFIVAQKRWERFDRTLRSVQTIVQHLPDLVRCLQKF